MGRAVGILSFCMLLISAGDIYRLGWRDVRRFWFTFGSVPALKWSICFREVCVGQLVFVRKYACFLFIQGILVTNTAEYVLPATSWVRFWSVLQKEKFVVNFKVMHFVIQKLAGLI